MSIKRTLLALTVLAAVMLTGCKDPVSLPGRDVRAATVTYVDCTVAANISSGHFDWYKGVSRIWDSYSWSYGSPITRAYYDYYSGQSSRAYPRKNGYCIFQVPHFTCPAGIPACTLYLYQTAHSGSASLKVTAWDMSGGTSWPPMGQSDMNSYFWAIWNGTVIATDVAHTTDNCWYKVALSTAACGLIADSAAQQGGGRFNTGWVYPDSVDGTYTDVTGYDYYHAPFIRAWYDDGQ